MFERLVSRNGGLLDPARPLDVIELGSRRSGRTERMLARLKSGDRVFCRTEKEAEFLRRELRKRGLENIVVTHAPRESKMNVKIDS